MPQYVLQIEEDTGWLAKCFQVSPECPIPEVVPEGREQVVMTNTDSFWSIVNIYNQYTTGAVFNYDEAEETIYCLAPPEAIGEWPKD